MADKTTISAFKQITEGLEPNFRNDGMPIEQSIEGGRFSTERVEELRKGLFNSLHQAQKSEPEDDPYAFADQESLETDLGYPKSFIFDFENNATDKGAIDFLKRLSNKQFDDDLRQRFTKVFLEHGFFENEKHKRELSDFILKALGNSKASFFRDNQINKQAFFVFVMRARKLVPDLMIKIFADKHNSPIVTNFIAIANETNVSKQKLVRKVINDFADNKIPLDFEQIENLDNIFEALFFDSKQSFKSVLKSIIDQSNNKLEGHLEKLSGLAIDMQNYYSQIPIDEIPESDSGTLEYDSDLLDNPKQLYKDAKEQFSDLAIRFNRLKRRSDFANDLFLEQASTNPDEVTKDDLESLLNHFSLDVGILNKLDEKMFDRHDYFYQNGIELFNLKSRNPLFKTLDLMENVLVGNSELSKDDVFNLVSNTFSKMQDQGHLNTEFLQNLGGAMMQLDRKRANSLFLTLITGAGKADKGSSPYAFDYEVLEMMLSSLAQEEDRSIQLKLKNALLKEYRAQTKFSKEDRALPLLFTLFSDAQDHVNLTKHPKTGKVKIEKPAHRLPVLAGFLSYNDVDFPEMIDMLTNTQAKFRESREEHSEVFGEYSQKDFEFDGYGDDSQSPSLPYIETDKLKPIFLDVVAKQINLRKDLPDDLVSNKLLEYFHDLAQEKGNLDMIKSLGGRVKQFLSMQREIHLRRQEKLDQA